VACVELFYFAYRDFTCDPDTILAQYGFGRAHHRVLHFVHRNPGLKVAQLLEILKITKQSLARVLKQLIDEGFVVQRAGDEDRRERRLYVSTKGTRLTEKLTDIQVKRVESALAKAGPGAEALTRRFLFGMIAEQDRSLVEALTKLENPGGTAAVPPKPGNNGAER
jgi:DNA-binding MarR family transcriptional regulator